MTRGSVGKLKWLEGHRRQRPSTQTLQRFKLVTLARWLQDPPRDQTVAVLSERLGRAERLRRMLNDSDWDVCVDARGRARMLFSYLQEVDDLIPDDLPQSRAGPAGPVPHRLTSLQRGGRQGSATGTVKPCPPPPAG